VQELSKEKAAYKLHVRKQMKAKKITKRDIIENPQLIEDKIITTCFCFKKALKMKIIEEGITKTLDKI